MNNKTEFSITPTSGGVISTKNVVCRELHIQRYWEILLTKGISLFAERRFGKSAILRKMKNETPEAFNSVYLSVQAINNSDEFVEDIYQSLKSNKLISLSNLTSIENVWNTFSEMVPEAFGAKFGKRNQVWKKKLNYLINNTLDSHQNKILVIFLDEYSLMLDAMDAADATELIGFLRDIVHENFPKRLRFVFAGSISIDLILDKIRKKGHNLGDPLNHTERTRVEPFDLIDTLFFCQCLELGCKITLNDELRRKIFDITGGIPYFIDKIFDRIRYQKEICAITIEIALENTINDPDDKTNLGYYYDRIQEHYPSPKISHSILKFLCFKEAISETDLINFIMNLYATHDEQEIQDEIARLWKDGYLSRIIEDKKRIYRFQYAIIKKWWEANKA